MLPVCSWVSWQAVPLGQPAFVERSQLLPQSVTLAMAPLLPLLSWRAQMPPPEQSASLAQKTSQTPSTQTDPVWHSLALWQAAPAAVVPTVAQPSAALTMVHASPLGHPHCGLVGLQGLREHPPPLLLVLFPELELLELV
jgi:hypothetical protein